MLNLESDEYCPHCDNHFVLEAKTPKASLQVEGEDVRKDARYTIHTAGSRAALTAAECSRTSVCAPRYRGPFSTSRMLPTA